MLPEALKQINYDKLWIVYYTPAQMLKAIDEALTKRYKKYNNLS